MLFQNNQSDFSCIRPNPWNRGKATCLFSLTKRDIEEKWSGAGEKRSLNISGRAVPQVRLDQLTDGCNKKTARLWGGINVMWVERVVARWWAVREADTRPLAFLVAQISTCCPRDVVCRIDRHRLSLGRPSTDAGYTPITMHLVCRIHRQTTHCNPSVIRITTTGIDQT